MAFCSFSDRFSMLDVTPLENLFIEEYMVRAPGDFVKVYIYGLRLCYHPMREASVETLSRTLGLEVKTVTDAFAYWERQGLVRRVADNPPDYTFSNLKDLLMTGANTQSEIPAQYRSFNAALQDLFGTRLLRSQEYERVYNWIEDLGIRPEVVLLLCKHCIENSGKGQSVTFAFIEKEALRWVKKGATTIPTAEDHLHTLSQAYEGAQRILRHWGLRRAPSVDEEVLYTSWTQEMGFTHEAIVFACRELTKIPQPNFAYLNKVLENMKRKALATGSQMAQAQTTREDVMRPVRDILVALGTPSLHPTEELAMLYGSWLQQGFTPDALQHAAAYALRRGKSTMEELDRILCAFAKESLYTQESMENFLQRRRKLSQQLHILFDSIGITRTPTAADMSLMDKWRAAGIGLDVLTMAAEYSRAADDPMRYMARIVENWVAKGISTPEAALKERERWIDAPQGRLPGAQTASVSRPSKEVGAHRYTQHSYTDEELDTLFDDPNTL